MGQGLHHDHDRALIRSGLMTIPSKSIALLETNHPERVMRWGYVVAIAVLVVATHQGV